MPIPPNPMVAMRMRSLGEVCCARANEAASAADPASTCLREIMAVLILCLFLTVCRWEADWSFDAAAVDEPHPSRLAGRAPVCVYELLHDPGRFSAWLPWRRVRRVGAGSPGSRQWASAPAVCPKK